MTPLELYTQALKHHDWYYQRADDSRSFRRGHDSYNRLVAMRRELDPEGTLWAQYQPKDA